MQNDAQIMKDAKQLVLVGWPVDAILSTQVAILVLSDKVILLSLTLQFGF